MSTRIIRRMFSSRLATWAGDNNLPVAWENVPFDPPATTHLRFYLLPAGVDSQDLAGAHRQYVGLVQVSIFGQIGEGPDRLEVLADGIAALFPLNLRITEGAFAVQVMTPVSATPLRLDDDRPMVSARFRYQADTI